MALSAIEWTDYTFNPWIGCAKVHAGCAHCYAEADQDKRRGRVAWGPHGTRSKTAAANWRGPLTWNREAEGGICVQCGRWDDLGSADCYCGQYGAIGETRRPRVFCASLADVFENWQGQIVDHQKNVLWWRSDRGVAPAEQTRPSVKADRIATMDDLRRDLFALIDATPHLDWLLLTKRPENIARFWGWGGSEAEPMRRDNVWLGTSVSDQASAAKQIPELLACRDLSPVLFLSCEPLLGPIELEYDADCFANPSIDWVIAGGESGPNARPLHPDWARGLRDQCAAAGVPFFFKQWGEWLPGVSFGRDETPIGTFPAGKFARHEWVEVEDHESPVSVRVGKKAAGRLLDGREWSEFPGARTRETC